MPTVWGEGVERGEWTRMQKKEQRSNLKSACKLYLELMRERRNVGVSKKKASATTVQCRDPIRLSLSPGLVA